MQMLSVKQAATKLHKSEATVRRWAACGKLSAQKRGGRWEILSLELNFVSSENKPKAQAELMQSAIDKIVDGVSRKMAGDGAVANSSSRASELEREVKNLSLQNEGFMFALKKVYRTVEKLQKEQKRLLAKVCLQEQVVHKQALQIARIEASNPKKELAVADYGGKAAVATKKLSGAKISDEEKAERWTRNNTSKWLNEICRAERTWRELATNVGELVSIRGKLQKPRSHLHIIAKTDKSAWNRMKAKVALELFPSDSKKQFSQNHYEHEFEVGGG